MAKSQTPAEVPAAVRRPPRPVPRLRSARASGAPAAGVGGHALQPLKQVALDAASTQSKRMRPSSLHVDPQRVANRASSSSDELSGQRPSAADLAGAQQASAQLASAQLASAQLSGDEWSGEAASDGYGLDEGAAEAEAISRDAEPVEAAAMRVEARHEEQPIPLGVRARRVGIGSQMQSSPQRQSVPLVTLEEPSSSRFDLTPSPVPRVQLSPATGSLDISLVPGPHSTDVRNLPTLAARHVLGRSRLRAAAPALTFPPNNVLTSEARIARSRGPRSSRREIVLGLGIGIGLSAVLGVFGFVYFDPGASDPTLSIESTTNALAPAARATDLQALVPPVAAQQVPAAQAVESSGAAPPPTVSGSTVSATDGASGSSEPRRASSTSSAVAPGPTTEEGAIPASRVARAGSAKAAGGRQTAARRAEARARERDAYSDESSAGSGRPLDEGQPAEKRPLSPSESAGLGLDLPF
jgi:hypothetical protein